VAAGFEAEVRGLAGERQFIRAIRPSHQKIATPEGKPPRLGLQHLGAHETGDERTAYHVVTLCRELSRQWHPGTIS